MMERKRTSKYIHCIHTLYTQCILPTGKCRQMFCILVYVPQITLEIDALYLNCNYYVGLLGTMPHARLNVLLVHLE